MAKQILGALIAVAAIVLLLIATRMRTSGGRPPAREATSPRASEPSPTSVPTALPAGTASSKGRPLLSYLEAVGRAAVLKNRRTLAALLASPPDAIGQDRRWLVEQLRAPLYVASGACVLIARLKLHEAVGGLDDLLRSPVSGFLKDLAIDALAELPGDASEAVLLGILGGSLDASIRANCARALGGFEHPAVYYALASASQRDPSPAVRKGAAEGLARLQARDCVPLFLAQVRQERNPVVALRLLELAWHAGGERVLSDLREAVRDNTVAGDALLEAVKRRGSARYLGAFPPSFFSPGGATVPFDPACHSAIGVTVELGPGMTVASVARDLFAATPFDRYRAFFCLREAREYAADAAAGIPSPRAYDASGAPIPGGVPSGELDGTVYLAFRDATTFAPGILGVTEGTKAQVTTVSLLHELGHAFAFLGDEYSGPVASQSPAENLWPRKSDSPPRWKPLADRGFVPAEPEPRIEIVNGIDAGQWFVPSPNCHMANRATDSRYCPVCQLEIIARIAELTGVKVPW